MTGLNDSYDFIAWEKHATIGNVRLHETTALCCVHILQILSSSKANGRPLFSGGTEGRRN
jgi:hypothetical protein